ncbi:transporter [Ganoderma sinense ZZ0214-1]|uniref:Transporter n=1 Tax=Ganoderma sinense ZZ0214-1 TaxID=1077348 RepID=A0A2G8SRQ1_9APHY|nr:transporter [Ganoderma sinense ZZ0214-1]
MSSLNAAQSQSQQVAPMQISQSTRPSTSSGRQNVSAGPSSMPQAPEPPRPHPQPHGPERNHPGTIALQPAPASAQFPQTPQASAHPPPTDALPTPPSTSAGPPNVQSVMMQLANQQARSILEPMRDSIASALSAVHVTFAEELSKAHHLIVKSEARARDSQSLVGMLRDELARVCAERDRAVERCEQMKKEREAALEEMRKMNENLPKLVVEHFQLKGDHDNLRQELVALKETNAQLREKASLSLEVASRYRTQTLPPELLQYTTGIPGVKLEFPTGTSGAANPAPIAQVKEERITVKESSSPTDLESDADVAFALARDFKVRKNRLRSQTDPEQERHHSISRQHPPPPSEAAASPSFMRINPPPCDVPPTPPADRSPQSRKIPLVPVNARPQTPPARGAQSSDTTTGTHGPKLEEVEALQSALLSIPQLGHMDVTGELDIIDLTLDCEMFESPAKLPLDLPSLPPCAQESDPSEERKRTVEPEWNERQETPNKRQRTEDQVDGGATQDVMMEDSNSPEFNEAFLRSLIEVAEIDASTAEEASGLEVGQTTASPAPVLSAGSAHHGDGQDIAPSPALGVEPKSNGHNDRGDQRREPGPAANSTPQPATNSVPVPPSGLLTPPSPTYTTIPPPIPRPAQRSESKPQQAPVTVSPAPAPAPVSPATVTPAPCPASAPLETTQHPSPSAPACPPPPPSTPSPSSPRLPATSPKSPCVSPPLTPPARSISITTKPLPSRLSVATSSSSQGPPVSPSASPSVSFPQVPPVTPVMNALAGINLSLPSPTNAVQLPTEVPVASPSKPEPPKKLGIIHIDIVYRRVGCGYYQCRFCERRHKEVPTYPATKFAANAPGYILTEHVEKEHPTTVEKMLEMTPEDIRENKQKLEFMDSESAPAPQKKRKSSG